MKRKCKIHLARTAGFCFGVRRAIRMAHELALQGGTTLMLGDLVHNQDVIRELEKSGIKKISRLGNGRNKTLVIRAHGAGKRLMAQAKKHGYLIADATCPMVHAIHEIVRRMDKKGYRIIVLGDCRHEEVQGIVGQINKKSIVIENIGEIPEAKRIKKAAIVVQSTQNTDDILPIVTALRKMIKEVKFFNTICRPTRMKQAEMKALPLHSDVVIIIGSRTSANTKRLYEISCSLNPRSYWIESAAQLKKAWLRRAKSVGITTGASTPESVTRAVVARIRKMAGYCRT